MQTLVALLAVGSLMALAAGAKSKRTCHCEIRSGKDTFSDLVMEVTDPVMSGYVVTCRRARTWCPQACYTAAKKQLLGGGVGGVAPLTGDAGMNACQTLGLNITADLEPQVHLYAVYRVSNCMDTGYFYLGRLCCWQYELGDIQLFVFNEGCSCIPQPPCELCLTLPTLPTNLSTLLPTTPTVPVLAPLKLGPDQTVEFIKPWHEP